MHKQVRVRFSPSPSGLCLHIGGARTTLFNWAWAKKTGGKLVVRIEDTDADRSTKESKQVILDSLRWLNLNWDEGIEVGGDYAPYVQSERKDIYRQYADKLISEGKAYKCYCTEEELASARDEWIKNNPKVGFKYAGTCKNRKEPVWSKDTRNEAPYVIRLVAKRDGTTSFDDLIFGKITTPNVENQDWVIIRTDGLPLYNYAAVLDDALMGITLVARGADHLQNTIPQILMYEALGFSPPQFAHMPLVRGKDNEKLSKRNASVGVFEYRDQGYAPGALLNYLARLGWAKGDAEIFSMDEFVEMFDWSNTTKKDSKWDPAKLLATNIAHLRSEKLVPDSEYAHHTLPFVQKLGIDATEEQLLPYIKVIRSRAKTFIESAKELEPFLRDTISIDETASAKLLTAEVKQKLSAYTEVLSSIDTWTSTNLNQLTNDWLTRNNFSIKEIGQPIRLGITGRTTSPELFETMSAIGKSRTIDRLKNASK